MGYFLGIDTSNYRTSVAICDTGGNIVASIRRLLPVAAGELGLRQSDACFHHVAAIPQIMRELGRYEILAVGVSSRPRDVVGSYMPCFLVGSAIASSISAINGTPCYDFSHQLGHIEAAKYSTRVGIFDQSPFIAFHVSGGTTECLFCDGENIKLLGGTKDINAGQLIDRVGQRLGIPFPSGEGIEALADGVPYSKIGKISVSGCDCNLSGAENIAATMQKNGKSHAEIAAFTLDFVQKTIEKMTENALKAYPCLPILYAGGVMSNKRIAKKLKEKFDSYFATPEFSGDNACGIARLAMKRFYAEKQA